MKLSVITVCFNAARTIRHTIESFLAQSHTNKELLIIDGASTDATIDIARSFDAPCISITSEPDRGIYDAMNKGLHRFTGDAVGFLNADDRFASPTALSAISTALENVDIAFGNLDFVADHESKRIVRKWRGEPYRRGAFQAGWLPAHPTFYVKRRVAQSVGTFDTTYKIAADYDYMLRAIEVHQFKSVFIEQVLVEMMQGGASNGSVSAYVRGNIQALRSRRRHLGSGVVDWALIAKPLRKLGQFAPALSGR
jgi:glycosyltransferase involved in cell wall biosynthesis